MPGAPHLVGTGSGGGRHPGGCGTIGAVDTIEAHLGISLINAIGVVISATILYVALSAVVRVWGRRLTANPSTGSIALVTLVGSIAARATLGNSPNLLGGLVAIGTLVLLERIFGRWSSATRGLVPRWGRSAVVLMAGQSVRTEALTKFGMTEAMLWSQLRTHGIRSRDEVAVVVLEPRGSVSVLRASTPLDRALFAGVDGVEDVPPELFKDF